MSEPPRSCRFRPQTAATSPNTTSFSTHRLGASALFTPSSHPLHIHHLLRAACCLLACLRRAVLGVPDLPLHFLHPAPAPLCAASLAIFPCLWTICDVFSSPASRELRPAPCATPSDDSTERTQRPDRPCNLWCSPHSRVRSSQTAVSIRRQSPRPPCITPDGPRTIIGLPIVVIALNCSLRIKHALSSLQSVGNWSIGHLATKGSKHPKSSTSPVPTAPRTRQKRWSRTVRICPLPSQRIFSSTTATHSRRKPQSQSHSPRIFNHHRRLVQC